MASDEKKEEKNMETIDETAAPVGGTDPTADSAADAARNQLEQERLYLRAEFENSKRRLQRESETLIRFANEKVFGELLGIVDLFDRALDSGTPLVEGGSAEFKGFVKGIEMTHRELIHLLERFNVTLTGKVGEAFDPKLHEAVSQAPVDPEKVDTVVAVVHRGCLFEGRLLKPARVVVGVAA